MKTDLIPVSKNCFISVNNISHILGEGGNTYISMKHDLNGIIIYQPIDFVINNLKRYGVEIKTEINNDE